MQDFKKLISAGLPTMLVGSAGTGKTSILRQFALDNNRVTVDLRTAMMPPEDLVGIPKVKDGCFEYLPPEWAHKHANDKGARLLIILEEIHLAPPAMHAALYQLLQEKEVAGIDLSNAWIAATANPPEQAGAALCGELPEALRDRLEVVNFKAHMVENETTKWLQVLANNLQISKEVQEACGLDGLDMPITPRACERLLRLIAVGVRDESLISRRAGNITSKVLNALNSRQDADIDILAKAATPDRAVKHVVFTGEGFK